MNTEKSFLQVLHRNKESEKLSVHNKKIKKRKQSLLLIFVTVMITSFLPGSAFAQNKNKLMRIAKIVVDSSQLEHYKAALKEGMEAAVSKEPGVLMLYAVYEKDNPTHVTVFEIYADEDAYKLHIQTPHFLKYKSAVKDMVKSLQLNDVLPIALESKTK